MEEKTVMDYIVVPQYKKAQIKDKWVEVCSGQEKKTKNDLIFWLPLALMTHF